MLVNWSGGGGVKSSFRLDRSVEETTLPGASSYLLTEGRLSIEAKAGSRLALGASLTGSSYNYRGVARSEFVIGANTWARYWFEEHLFLGVDYGLSQRTSNAAGYDYDRNRLMLSVGAQLEPQSGVSGGDARPVDPGGFYFATEFGHGALTTGLDGPRGTGTLTSDFGDQGVEIGIAVGYGMAFGRLYLGAEVEAFGGGPDWRHNGERVFSVERGRSVDAGIRLGILTNRKDLVYARVAGVWTRYRTSYANSGETSIFEGTRAGLGFGLGLESAVGRNGFVRTEYSLTSGKDYDIPSGTGAYDNFSNAENRFRVGVGVRFGGNPQRDDPAIDFSGFYIGANLGHGALVSSNQGPRSGGFVLDATRSGQGGLLGVFAGGGQLMGRIYAGVEVRADVSRMDWNIERDPQGRIYSIAHDYSFGAGVRLGLTVSRSTLIYARAGAVRTRFDAHYATSGASVRETSSKTGLNFGGGLEFGLGPKARLRLEYGITQYPDYSVSYGNSAHTFKNYENSENIGFSWKI